MQNGTNLSQEMLNSLLAMAKRGKNGQESVKSILNQSLSDSQKKSLSQLMADPQRLKEMLSSPEAKALMQKLSGTEQGENGNGPA